jgi:hypothetical protein
MNILLITIGAILWLLIGFIFIRIQYNAYCVTWYKIFNEHFIDSEDYYKDLIWELGCHSIFILFGLISAIIMLPGLLDKRGNYYYKNSLYMIFYNKQKVENHFKNKQ